MKPISELKRTPRLVVCIEGSDGGMATAHLVASRKNTEAKIIFSWGGEWDHVSVSFPNRCPTWEEMCEIKRMFFRPEEVVVQYHPAERQYVNAHPYCLHLWRYQRQEIPAPPYWMVGPKDGQSLLDAVRIGEKELKKHETHRA